MLPFHQRDDLISKWDQDHAMFLGLGTPSGLWQSVQLKPPNMKSVYPVTPVKQLDGIIAHDGPVVVFNAESERKDDLLFSGER